MKDSLNVQVGGTHYKKMPYQPVEFAAKADLNFIQGNMVKYLLRYKDKNGKQDLEKIIHYAQLGNDLAPINFFTNVEQFERFVLVNEISDKVRSILECICYQMWTTVIIKVGELINEDYETVS